MRDSGSELEQAQDSQGQGRASLFYARLFTSRDGRLFVEDAPHDAVRVIAGRADDFRFADLGPEEVAHLAHALNQWIARFTSNA